jgi:hypothetical protein
MLEFGQIIIPVVIRPKAGVSSGIKTQDHYCHNVCYHAQRKSLDRFPSGVTELWSL